MTSPTRTTSYDVAVVGAGPAGLATAHRLRGSGLSVRVLEAAPEVGGRTLSVALAGEQVNTGAMFVYRDTPMHTLARELAVSLEPFRPSTYGVHLDGVTVVSRDNDDLLDRLPLGDTERATLRAFVQRAVAVYRSHTDGAQLLASAYDLARLPASSQLAELSGRARAIVEAAIRGGSVAKASQLSAHYALRYFASYLAHEQDNRLLPLDGMQSIWRAIAASLPADTVWTSTRVDRVRRQDDGRWSLKATRGGAEVDVRARHVVLAVPAPVVGTVCDLPAWKAAALAQVLTPGSTTLTVVAEVSGPVGRGATTPDASADLDAWSFVATPGMAFDAVINPRPGRADGRVQLACYGNSAGFLPDVATGDSGRIREWLDDVVAVAPQLGGRVLDAHLQTWEHCFSLLTHERAAVLDELREPLHGTLHFAGDYCSETAGTHGAVAEAERVATAVIDGLIP